MSSEDPEEGMIEDWRGAIEDLKDNNRHEIIALTNLARELTAIAFPISEVLEQHIKKAPPQRKLPATYLLDSIVKNVGTPYTLYFGKNLYQTFMDVYASVDQRTRQKLEEMLQTWKEPVPGSIDTTPVFPPDVVRPIENALLKARTSALNAQQEQMRAQMRSRGARPAVPGYRATPTPPNARAPFNQPPYPGANGHRPDAAAMPQQQQQPYHQNVPGMYSMGAPQHPPSASAVMPFTAPQGQPGISIDALNHDIEQIIVAVGSALGRSPHSHDIQTELKALLALQGLLRDKHKNLPQEQLAAVRNQVESLSVKYRVSLVARRSVTPTPVPPAHAHAAPYHAPLQPHHPPPPPQHQLQQQPPSVAPVPPASTPVSLDSLLGKGALAALMNRNSATPQPAASTTPQMAPAVLRSPTPQRAEPQKSATPDPLALLGALRGAGLLPPTPQQPGQTPIGSKPLAPPPPAAPPAVAPSSNGAAAAVPAPLDLASIIARAQNIAASVKKAPVLSSGGIAFTALSLMQPQPHLVASLYDALGPQCTQCGRRFPLTDEGKKNKTAHMDWHFRVHQRMVETEKRGQHRSWYVDQADWIHNIEALDLDHQPDTDGAADATASSTNASSSSSAAAAAAAAAAAPKQQYIPVPDSGDGTNTVCPICQEKFVTKWLDEAQEWVWTDARRVGGRAFHASCYAEVTKESGAGLPLYGGAAASRATPDRVLGKRKAEDEILPARGGRPKAEL